MCTGCGGFLFETTWLTGPNAGQVTGRLHPVAAEWEELLSRPATANLTLPVRKQSQADVWPDQGFFISQVDVLNPNNRRGRFGGYLTRNNGVGGGALPVTAVSMDAALLKRNLAGPDAPYSLTSFIDSVAETVQYTIQKPVAMNDLDPVAASGLYPATKGSLAAFLVKIAQGNTEGEGFTGVPILDSVLDPPYTIQTGPVKGAFVDAVQNWWDFKNIGQLIAEMVSAEDGIEYWLEHIYTNGYWRTVMHFSDRVGTDRDYTIKSDREAQAYGLEVDGSNRASRVYGVGGGSEWNTQFSVAYDSGRDPNFPEWHDTVTWKDQTVSDTINGLTAGQVADRRDPTTIPSATLVGMPDYDPDAAGFDPQKGFPRPEICRPGDTFGVDIGYGAITVKDLQVRNLGVSWSLKEGVPVERTIAMQPVVRAANSVRTQVPALPPAAEVPVDQSDPQDGGGGSVTADPWPTPGKLTNIQTTDLTEISGMEIQHTTPGGYVWVLEDEFETPDQVSCVSRKTGERVGWFTPNPGVSAAPVGDPEAIRYSYVSDKLVIADTGDNDLDRPTSGANQPHLLVVTEPAATFKGTVAATKLPIAYPGGERINVETLLIHTKTDEVFLVSKESNRARVFSYGALSAMSTVNNVGTLVATLNLPQVADGCHVANGNFVLFRTATKSETVVMKSWNWLYGGIIGTPAMTKCEAITIESTCAFFVTTEGVNPPIYRVLIPTSFGATCSTPEGPDDDPPASNPSATVPGQLIPMNNWKLQLPI